MNSQNVIKKTLPLIIILVLIIGFAVTCTVLKKDKVSPSISDGDSVYLSTREDSFTYTINKGKMYDELKQNVGLSTLITLVNKDLLTKEGFYDKVTNEEIDEALEKDIFADGKDDLTDEEILEKQEEYKDKMYSNYGLRDDDEIREYHRLILAKKLYASSKLDKEISDKNAAATTNSEKYFTDTDYSDYYNKNYQEEFWAVIVPYTTEAQAKNALAQLGISIHQTNAEIADDFNYWYWTATEAQLTPQEVVKAILDLYNAVYAYKCENYPTEKILVKEGVQYTIDEFGNYVFNTTVSEDNKLKNTFHYTYKELSDYQTSILNSMKNTWVAYNANSKVEANAKWYTPTVQSYNSGALYCYILKIAEQPAVEMQDVYDEITDALVEAKLTTTYIETKMAELRAEYELTIYDVEMEKTYVSSMTNYGVTHKTTKKSSKTLVAATSEKEYSTEDLFKAMDYKYGTSIAMSLLNYERFMTNTKFNTYYDYTKEGKEKDKWLDKTKYNELKEQVANEKLVFTSGTYSSYGYSPSDMTWLEFIKEIYGANDENELLLQYLFSDLISDYQKKLADVSEASEESELWQFYKRNMFPIANSYFKVSGVHTLICVYDNPGSTTPINPDEWSDIQVAYAAELQAAILNYLDNNEGTVQEKMEAFVAGYKACLNYLPTIDDVNEQPVVEGASYTWNGIDCAKYRSAGLSVKYEDLGEFENGKMVSEFDAAVKSIYDLDPSSESMTLYRNELKTQYGYHVYANLTCTKQATYDDNGTEEVLPTLEIVKKYLADSSDESLTDAMKTAITTYFTPIKSELSGSYNTYINEYTDLRDLIYDLSNTNYTIDLLQKSIDEAIKSWQEQLKYTE